jgi:hypothetical protein
MKHIFIIFFLSIFTVGCKNDDSASFALSNISQYEISEVKLYVNVGVTNLLLLDSIDMNIVQSGASIHKVILENKLPKSDGGFYLRFKQNDNIVSKEFGYFTNGGLLDKQYKITVTDDDVTVSTK